MKRLSPAPWMSTGWMAIWSRLTQPARCRRRLMQMSEFAAWVAFLILGVIVGVQTGIDIQKDRHYKKLLDRYQQERIERYKELKRKEYPHMGI